MVKRGVTMRHSLGLLVVFAAACTSEPDNGLPVVSAPTRGEQVVIGPFDVPMNSEVQMCRTLKLSNTEPVAVNRLQVVLNEGSHHFILFRSRNNVPMGDDQTFPCWGTVNFDDWEFLLDVNRDGGDDWTLDQGQGFIMEPHQQIMIQSHYVNANTVQTYKPGGGVLNLYETDPAKIPHKLYGMFTVDTHIAIPPHSYYSTSRNCSFNNPVNVVAMTGHFHARGLTFTVDRISQDAKRNFDFAAPTIGGQIYESDNWNAPPFTLFDGKDAAVQPLFIRTDGVQFTCSYFNDTDNLIGWGGHADTQEHCNLFFQYYDYCPEGQVCDDSKHTPLDCFEGTGGW
jgi:hypothetical protein